MAATMGLRLPSSSSRCIACWPPRDSAVASACVFTRASISTSAPITKLSGLPEASTTPLTFASSEIFLNASSNSSWKSERSVLALSPGTSRIRTATPSCASMRNVLISSPLQNAGRAEAAGGADRDQRRVPALLFQLAQRLVHEARAGAAERVPERDASAARVQLLLGDFADRLGAAEVLVGKLLRSP